MRKLIPACFGEKINSMRAQLQNAGQKWSAKALQLPFLLIDKQGHCHGKHPHVASLQSLQTLPLNVQAGFHLLETPALLLFSAWVMQGLCTLAGSGEEEAMWTAWNLAVCLASHWSNSAVGSCHLGTRQRCWAGTPTWRNCLRCWLYILNSALGCMCESSDSNLELPQTSSMPKGRHKHLLVMLKTPRC